MSINFERATQNLIDSALYRNADDSYVGYSIRDGSEIGFIGTVKEKLYFGFIDAEISADKLKEVFLSAGAHYSRSDFIISVQDNPTLEIKLQEFCTGGSGEYSFTTQMVVLDSSIPLNNISFGKIIYQDYRMTVNDDVLGVVTAYGEVVITIPDTVFMGMLEGNISWDIYKMTGDSNKVKIMLENPEQSLVKYSMRYLTHIGMAVKISMYKAGNVYWFTDISTQASLVRAEFVNLTPKLNEGKLTLRGYLTDLANNHSVNCHFRYRESEEDDWLGTLLVQKTSVGSLEEIVSVTGDSIQTQMVVEDFVGGLFYSTVLLAENIKPYYPDLESAMSDGIIRLWNLQEHTGIDEDGIDLIEGDTLKFYNGVTFGSDIVGDDTVYKRIFTGNAYGESKLKIQKKEVYTICLLINMSSFSGDHTIISTGKNIMSLASDQIAIQLEVDGNVYNWANALPFNGFKTLFITVDPKADKTNLYDVTSQEALLKISIHDTISKKGIFFRLGKGTSGDANHQDNEYMDNGSVRTLCIWDEVLPIMQMVDIASNFEKGGLLI